MQDRPIQRVKSMRQSKCCSTDDVFLFISGLRFNKKSFCLGYRFIFARNYNSHTQQSMDREEKVKDDEEEQILSDQQSPNRGVTFQQPEAIVYGDSSLQMRCPYCLELIRSEIVLKPQLISVALGICIFAIVPNFVMILLIMTLLQITASRKHRCPLCQRELGSDGRFLLYLTDEVYSMSFLSAGLIFTKKNLVTASLIVIAVAVIACRTYYQNSNKFIATTWSEYLNDCGQNEPAFCLQKYKDKEFKNWEGHLLRLEDNQQYQSKWYLHAISLYMKMDPTPHDDGRPDILLTINSDVLFYHGELVKNLVHGDQLKFNCSLHDRERGSLKDVMHFHISELELAGHDSKYAMYTKPIEEEWIKIHVQDRGRLRSEPQASDKIKPI